MLQEQLERLVQSAETGDPGSREQLFAALYRELHCLAERQLRRGGAFLTISPTTLLHETYVNLSGRRIGAFPDQARFLAYAARAMRGLLIDYVRSRRAQKRGGAFEITALPAEVGSPAAQDGEMEAIGEALEALAAVEPRLAHVVDLKFFCGFTVAEIAGLLGSSKRTVQRDWDKARILLQGHLQQVAARGSCPRPQSLGALEE